MIRTLGAKTKFLGSQQFSSELAGPGLNYVYFTNTFKVKVVINGININCKASINVLGIIFISKLNWNDQVANVIKKTNTALHFVLLQSQ